MVLALTGVNDGSFTRLEVLKDGAMKNASEIVGDATYDDSQLVQDIAANTAAASSNAASTAANSAAISAAAVDVAAHTSTLSQHTTAIAQKTDGSAVYSRAAVDALLAPQATHSLTTLRFSDIDTLGVNTLTIEGGQYIAIKDDSSNALMDLAKSSMTTMIDFNCPPSGFLLSN